MKLRGMVLSSLPEFLVECWYSTLLALQALFVPGVSVGGRAVFRVVCQP